MRQGLASMDNGERRRRSGWPVLSSLQTRERFRVLGFGLRVWGCANARSCLQSKSKTSGPSCERIGYIDDLNLADLTSFLQKKMTSLVV